MIFGTGIDIVNIKKLKKITEKWGDRFNKRIFTSQELEYCYQKNSPFQHLAARFAAKEAFLKALNPHRSGGFTPLEGETPPKSLSSKWGGKERERHLKWREIEINNDQGGQPLYRLKGYAKFLASKQKINLFLTISHSGDYAIAHCLLEK